MCLLFSTGGESLFIFFLRQLVQEFLSIKVSKIKEGDKVYLKGAPLLTEVASGEHQSLSK